MPHHLFVIKKNKLYEKYVELKGDQFIEVLDEPSDNCIQNRISLIEKNIDNSTGEIYCEANSIFDGNLVADKVTLGGLVKGEVAANTLNVASSAKVECNLKTNALSIDLGAEVSGSITRIS